MSYLPVSRKLIIELLESENESYVYRVKDMIPFKVTGVGENVFIIKDRHGLEHTRQFNGPWLIADKTIEYFNDVKWSEPPTVKVIYNKEIKK